MNRKFFFKQENRHNWKSIIRNFQLALGETKKDVEVEIKEILILVDIESHGIRGVAVCVGPQGHIMHGIA